ncbi:hypothetical protein B484DRAFT_429172 [Ochromonadaceae sp. CCMP2298]|nr:hypothetical protein B484DRAFT_429172 [Ochromonadaceae sp. CCMP2298]
MLTNYLAKSNEFLHNSSRNVLRFAEFGVVVADMTHNTSNGPLELCTQYDGSDQAEEQHWTMRYNWNKDLVRYIHRLAVILFRATFKVDSAHPSLAQGWSPHYAELLDTVERMHTSGAADLSQYRRILEQEEDATDPVQAEIVMLLQVVEGHYHVRTYYSLLTDRAQDVGQGESPPVFRLAMAGPTCSMIPHILLELPLVQQHVQFRVADHPDGPNAAQIDHNIEHWSEALVVWLAEAWVRGTVEPVKVSERAIERNISRLMHPRPVRPTLRGGGGYPDDDGEDDEDGSTIRTRQSGSVRSRASGNSGHSGRSGRTTPSAATLPVRPPTGGSRQSESASERKARRMREAQGQARSTTQPAESPSITRNPIVAHPHASQEQLGLVSQIDAWHMMKWDLFMAEAQRSVHPPLAAAERTRLHRAGLSFIKGAYSVRQYLTAITSKDEAKALKDVGPIMADY